MLGHLLEGKHLGDGLFRVHRMDGFDHRGLEKSGIAGGTHAEIRVLLRELFERNIDHRARAACERTVRHVRGDADDGDPRSVVSGWIEAEAFADGRGFARPPAPRGVFADHRDARALGPIGRAEEPALTKWNVHGGEIIRGHYLEQRSGLVARLGDAILDGESAAIAVAAIGHGFHGESSADAGDGGGALDHLPVKRGSLTVFGVAVVGDRQPQREQRIRLEALAAVEERASAADHQAGADQQHHGERDLGGHQEATQAGASSAG